jgi:hypothetical protein
VFGSTASKRHRPPYPFLGSQVTLVNLAPFAPALHCTARNNMKASCGHHERNIRSPSRRGWCARDSSVESHAKRNLLHMKSINATSRLALVPSSDCGRKHHPTDFPAECKPSSRICSAAIELHFGTLQVQSVCLEARSVRLRRCCPSSFTRYLGLGCSRQFVSRAHWYSTALPSQAVQK